MRSLIPSLRAMPLAVLAVALAASPLVAQSPTPEGTTITSTATVSWTDANGNSYTPVSQSVSFVVGFSAGVDITVAGSLNPTSPSTGNTLTFTLQNIGNGVDSFTVSPTLPGGITITAYVYGTDTFTTLAALNNVIGDEAITAGGSLSFTIVYSVANGYGGQNLSIQMTGTSERDPTATAGTDTDGETVTPAITYGVTNTATTASRNRLPSNGTQYSETFTVRNTGNYVETYSLGGSANPGTALSIVSVHGTAGASASITIAAGADSTVTVVYTVGGVATGTVDSLRLTATSTGDNSKTQTAKTAVTVIRAAITLAKAAYLDDQTTLITTQKPIPGDTLQYRITVTNNGAADANTVAVADTLPSQLEYVGTEAGTGTWSFSESGGIVSASLTGTLASGANRYFWVRVRVK